MKETFTIITFFISTILFGQNKALKSPFSPGYSIIILDSIPSNDIKNDFIINDGFGGFTLSFDSNGVFRRNSFSCKGHIALDSGIWKIENKAHLLLLSKTDSLKFGLVKYGGYYYLFSPEQKEQFIKDLTKQIYSSSYKKYYKVSIKRADYFLNRILGNKYFTKRIIAPITGT
ncbi:MAG: hypothetical protein U0T68_14415 [Ferruginibacter sp.]